jgi:ABC-type transporter Mla maintaining outer membrane lipid asymmetry ATPase subunit MlaF
MSPTPASAPIVRVEGLTAGYDDFVLLQDVSFTVNRGEVFVILGGSISRAQVTCSSMATISLPRKARAGARY